MATIKHVYGASSAMTFAGLSTAADGSTTTGDQFDNTGPKYLSMDLQIELTGAGSGSADIYMMASVDGSYPSVDELSNLTFIGSVNMGASDPVKLIRVEQLTTYFRFAIVNNSNASFSASTVTYRGINLSND